MYGITTQNHSGIIFKNEEGTFILTIILQNTKILKLLGWKYEDNSFDLGIVMSIHNRIDFLIFLKEVLEEEKKQLVLAHPVLCKSMLTYIKLYIETLLRRVLSLNGIIEELEEDIKSNFEYW